MVKGGSRPLAGPQLLGEQPYDVDPEKPPLLSGPDSPRLENAHPRSSPDGVGVDVQQARRLADRQVLGLRALIVVFHHVLHPLPVW